MTFTFNATKTVQIENLEFTLTEEGLNMRHGWHEHNFRWECIVPIARLLYYRYGLQKSRLYDLGGVLFDIDMRFTLYDNEVVIRACQDGVHIDVREELNSGDYTHWGVIPKELLQDRRKNSTVRQIGSFMDNLKKLRRSRRKEYEVQTADSITD
jgi:hypothetical protein